MCAARAIPEPMAMSEAAREAILQKLAEKPSRPTELLNALGDRFTDFEIKETLLYLLNDGILVLTSDRNLKLAENA
jgi:hypothetical protein